MYVSQWWWHSNGWWYDGVAQMRSSITPFDLLFGFGGPTIRRWYEYFSGAEHEEMREGFEVPIDLYQCMTDPTRVLGLASVSATQLY